MKWINIKEMIPDKYDRVIVTNGKQVCLHYKQSAFNDQSLYGIGCTNTNDCYSHGCMIDEDVTHWMRLPPLPEKK